jgi:hypothetical protein
MHSKRVSHKFRQPLVKKSAANFFGGAKKIESVLEREVMEQYNDANISEIGGLDM